MSAMSTETRCMAPIIHQRQSMNLQSSLCIAQIISVCHKVTSMSDFNQPKFRQHILQSSIIVSASLLCTVRYYITPNK